MIEKFATTGGLVESELLNLNHTSNSMSLVSLKSAKFAQAVAPEWRRTSQDGTLGEIPASGPPRSRFSQDRLIFRLRRARRRDRPGQSGFSIPSPPQLTPLACAKKTALTPSARPELHVLAGQTQGSTLFKPLLTAVPETDGNTTCDSQLRSPKIGKMRNAAER